MVEQTRQITDNAAAKTRRARRKVECRSAIPGAASSFAADLAADRGVAGRHAGAAVGAGEPKLGPGTPWAASAGYVSAADRTAEEN
ncbi:hypothetical protein [Sphaerisporangium dianthi]|uniref:Uncharacterized protein n=1 Tax=Sphaerisporangium dianthi TaxID=1436120 RepID=A0ABV9CNI6_9ACTN